MRSLLISLFAVAFLMLESSVALGFHDSMPKEIYTKLHIYGVRFIEYNGPVLRKDGCPIVRRTLLKTGPFGRTVGIALFVPEEDGTAERLVGADIRDGEAHPSFVWRAADFWRLAACHFPSKYRGRS
ncbi:MAG: hypothetical protein ACE5JQ_08915 [Candidatus Methylomirabilales bacterium]